ncbi:hypothetical protein AV654_15070 [Paenibacillus elgii]|uniref:DUF4367 domain-containing protein n=1 Tax=Paenibacillus elgii TaxID=189691 RepID=A0A163YM16_9BACL|nr:DUF4367 domain-containing protein [Paenibacillus elgii]KZE79621.1 hypothetical protein AV654_15070 [Paenibacillus elgii]
MTLDKDQDLKALFHDPLHMPDADLTGQVMKKLYAERNKKERFFVKYKVGVLVAMGMLLTVSSGFAAVKYGVLKNEQGQAVYEVKPLKSAPPQPKYSEEDTRRIGMSRDLAEELLPDGSAAIFYIVPNNPNKQTDTRFKPFVFNDVSALRAKMAGMPVKILDRLEENYQFQDAKVFFNPINEVNPPAPDEKAATAEKLRKQAEESGKDYAMMPIELSDDLLHLRSVYKHGDQEVAVTVIKSKDTFTAYVDEKIDFRQEKITVNGVEMLYTQYLDKDGKDGQKNITWNIDGEYTYQIDEFSKMSKEELIKIAEAYLN